MRQQPFTSPEEALEHYGVKGMRWGVRKEEDSSDNGSRISKDTATNNAKTKAYMAAAKGPRVSSKQLVKNVRQDNENFVKKFEPPAGEKASVRLTPTQKKLLIGGAVTVAAVGGIYLAKKYNVKPSSIKPGSKISLDQFKKLRIQSQYASLNDHANYITDASFKRSGFELPAGHTFHRLSYGNETTFGSTTYSLHSIADLHRYIANGFSGVDDFDMARMTHVSWQTTKPVKVPALTEVLDTVKDVLSSEHNISRASISDKEVVETYSKWVGGGWGDGTGYGGGRKLIEALKSKGYDALVDEGDAGILGESPLVFFGTDKVGPKTSTVVGKELVDFAKNNLTEIANRKP